MKAGAERKYTDRDVRDNPGEMFALVEEYLSEYTGEFEFLIDMKMRVSANYELTTGMVRGVLNCMRNDPRVTGLPEPSLGDMMAEVVALPRRASRKRRRVPCDNTEPHTHQHEDFEKIEYCPGIYLINRQDFVLGAKIKTPYMMGVSPTARIHRVDIGNENNGFTWHTHQHEYGYLRKPVTLHVWTQCSKPYNLKDPILIMRYEDVAWACDPQSGYDRTLCPYCFVDNTRF